MKQNSLFLKNLKVQGLSNIDIHQICNYLETLDYNINTTKYIGKIIAKNERLAKYFFLRDKLQIEIHASEDDFHINEILDQCIDWSEFWRLLVIKKGFCCIRLDRKSSSKKTFVFLSGPNILSGVSDLLPQSIYEDVVF